MSTSLPNITDDQRRAYLEKAKEARRARALIKKDLASGSMTFTQAVDDPYGRKIRVYDLLRSLPGIGPKHASSIMGAIGICETKRAAGLGRRQRALLESYLADNGLL